MIMRRPGGLAEAVHGTADAPRQLDVLHHNGDALGMDGAQVAVHGRDRKNGKGLGVRYQCRRGQGRGRCERDNPSPIAT